MMRSRLAFIGSLALVVLAVVLVIWLLPGASGRASAQPRPVSPRGDLLPTERTTIELFERTRVSVTFITTQTRVMDVWTRNMFDIPRGTGSGFIWDERGHVVTNHHVLAGATSARVRLSDDRDVDAKLVGSSPAHDLAVLRIDVDDLPPPIPLGSSADLKVGQMVLAIGNPFGLDWSLTTGIVSALDRSLPAGDGRNLIAHLIQTDAAINQGNSGGPLLDSAGRLIGVNTAIYSPSGAWAGVGFAIPVDTVNRVVPQLIATGRYVRPALGIQVDDRLNQLITRRMGIEGVVILEVTRGSGAAAAGLQGARVRNDGSIVPGDIILAIDGTPVDSVARLTSRLDDFNVGDTVRLTVLRDGQRRDVNVTLQAGVE